MQYERAKVVAEAGEVVFDQITDDRALAVVGITSDQDPQDGLLYFSYLVAIDLLPESIQSYEG
jgi:hypothetical protein